MIRTSLRHFMAVARLGSIRAASASLNVAQSAVSRRVQGLEHHLGCTLFDRMPNGVVMTEAGQVLFESGLRLEFEVDGMRSELGALRGMLRGRVRVAAIESMIPDVLPRAINRFRDLHPAITFIVEALPSVQVPGLIQDGKADIGIGLSARPGPDFLVFSSVREPLVAVTSPSHPLAGKERLELADLADCMMVLAPPPSASRLIFDEACRASGIRLTAAVETNSVDLMQRLAASGAVTLLLRHAIGGAIRAGQLKELDLSGQLFGGTLDIFAFKDRTLPAAVTRFAAILQEELAAGEP